MVLLPFFLLSATMVSAQSKEEKQRLKEEKKREKKELKILKKMDPRQIKAMKVGLEKKISELEVCTASRDSLSNAVYALQTKITEQETEIQESAGKANAKGKVGGSKSGNSIVPKKGIIFTVQLGAYKEFNISEKMGTGGLQLDEDEGMSKYLLGTFKSLDKAEAFRNEIARMGIKDAWVVAFRDGKRITKEEADSIIAGSSLNE